MAYLDAAIDRKARWRTSDFESMVEAVRAGTIVAHDKRAYGKWRAAAKRRSGVKERGLTGTALEQAVMRIAEQFPGQVVRA